MGKQKLLKNLKQILDKFSDKYKDELEIKEDTLELNRCFISSSTGDYQAPGVFGDLKENKIMTYVVLGAPFIEKYKREDNGKLAYEQGKFVIKDKDFIFKALACLCTKNMKNVSLHEIYDAISVNSETREVQGFRDWNIRNIVDLINSKYGSFSIEDDTAFIFAGQKENLLSKMELNKMWLEQIAQKGREALNVLNLREVELIKEVYEQKDINTPKSLAYMYNRDDHIPETGLFLEKKFSLFQDRQEKKFTIFKGVKNFSTKKGSVLASKEME